MLHKQNPYWKNRFTKGNNKSDYSDNWRSRKSVQQKEAGCILSCGLIIFRRNDAGEDQILLLEQNGELCPPKGLKRNYKSSFHCAQKAISDKINLKHTDDYELISEKGIYSKPYAVKNGKKQIVFLAAKMKNNANYSHQDVKWLGIAEAKQKMTEQNFKEILCAIDEAYGFFQKNMNPNKPLSHVDRLSARDGTGRGELRL